MSALATVHERPALEASELRRIVDGWIAARDVWEPHVATAAAAADGATRVCVELERDEAVEVWLLLWREGADTGLHDHGDAGAVLGVVRGAVVEERLTRCGIATRTFSEGARVGVPRHGIHRVAHADGAPAVTVHAYSPPLATMGTYVEDGDGELRRYLVEGADELRAGT